MDVDAVRGVTDGGVGPVTEDHGEHPPVTRQHVHGQRCHAPRLGPGDQRTHQRRPDPPALPGVGHYDPDVGNPAGVRANPFGQVGGHGVPDDDAVGDGDDGVDVGRAAGQQVEQTGGIAPGQSRSRGRPGPVTRAIG